MKKFSYKDATFLLSVAQLKQLPPDQGAEVAFAGRSNAGKSSALNVLTENKSLARTSKTPGRTQLINFFTLDDTRRLVDLPGYGFAKVPLAVKERWQRTLGQYLESRQCLRGLVLLMDIRHPLKEMDLNLINWATQNQLPVHILLTKMDKLSKSAAQATLQKVRKALNEHEELVHVQCFSSLKKQGLDELRVRLDEWLR